LIRDRYSPFFTIVTIIIIIIIIINIIIIIIIIIITITISLEVLSQQRVRKQCIKREVFTSRG
tara:strand:- start:495 stop:683 length:189 start_codon:yes stop_codon:yes gene_type:complete